MWCSIDSINKTSLVHMHITVPHTMECCTVYLTGQVICIIFAFVFVMIMMVMMLTIRKMMISMTMMVTSLLMTMLRMLMIMLMMSYVYGEDAETDEMRASALLADSASDTGVHYGRPDDDDDVVVVDDVDHDGDGDGDEWM